MHHFRRALLLAVAAAAILPAGARADDAAPSFDCSKASTAVEREICRKPELAGYDRQIADLYAQALGLLHAEDAGQLRTDQQLWLRLRDECRFQVPGNPHIRSDMAGCLADAMMTRIWELQKAVADKKFSRPCHPQSC
jgi:uncharacterized protein